MIKGYIKDYKLYSKAEGKNANQIVRREAKLPKENTTLDWTAILNMLRRIYLVVRTLKNLKNRREVVVRRTLK
jgi:hypothetical protein